MLKIYKIKQGKSSIPKKYFSLLIGTALLALTTLSAGAEAAYITDNFKITLRMEAAKDATVITLLNNGTKLEVLEESEDWTRVKIDDGKEGWVLKRYISEEIPQKAQIEKLTKNLDETSIKLKVTSEKTAGMVEENKDLKKELASSQERLKNMEATYKRLLVDSGNVVEIKKNYEENIANLNKAMAKIDSLQAENNELRSTSEFRWFLTGAGVISIALIFGFILGKMNRGKRHHSSFIS